jgi:hypothetical protein
MIKQASIVILACIFDAEQKNNNQQVCSLYFEVEQNNRSGTMYIGIAYQIIYLGIVWEY